MFPGYCHTEAAQKLEKLLLANLRMQIRQPQLSTKPSSACWFNGQHNMNLFIALSSFYNIRTFHTRTLSYSWTQS